MYTDFSMNKDQREKKRSESQMSKIENTMQKRKEYYEVMTKKEDERRTQKANNAAKYLELRVHRSATVIQKHVRGFISRKNTNILKEKKSPQRLLYVLDVMNRSIEMLAEKVNKDMKLPAIKIQSWVRGCLVRRLLKVNRTKIGRMASILTKFNESALLSENLAKWKVDVDAGKKKDTEERTEETKTDLVFITNNDGLSREEEEHKTIPSPTSSTNRDKPYGGENVRTPKSSCSSRFKPAKNSKDTASLRDMFNPEVKVKTHKRSDTTKININNFDSATSLAACKHGIGHERPKYVTKKTMPPKKSRIGSELAISTEQVNDDRRLHTEDPADKGEDFDTSLNKEEIEKAESVVNKESTSKQQLVNNSHKSLHDRSFERNASDHPKITIVPSQKKVIAGSQKKIGESSQKILDPHEKNKLSQKALSSKKIETPTEELQDHEKVHLNEDNPKINYNASSSVPNPEDNTTEIRTFQESHHDILAEKLQIEAKSPEKIKV